MVATERETRCIAGPATAFVCLQVRIDGRLVKEIKYSGCPTDDWTTLCKQSRKICVPIAIDLPKGSRRIVLENHGTLPMSASIDFRNYLKSNVANLRVLGFGNDSRAYLWIQNRDNTWWRNGLGKRPRTIKQATVTLTGMRSGSYALEWWDTYK